MTRAALCLFVLALACSRASDAPRAGEAAELLEPGLGLVDEARERGLDYVNVSGRAEKPTILEANGAGVALLDLGGDGDLDLVFAQGCASLEALLAGPGADLELFENDGAGRFRRLPGPGLAGWWTGLAVGDLDGDGLDDLVAGGFGQLAVLVQRDGKLVRIESGAEPRGTDALLPGAPRAAGLPPAWVSSLALLDVDGDGLLDLYVGRYLELDPVRPPLGALGEGALAVPCRWKGLAVYCGPRGLVAQQDGLFLGLGDGRFQDASAALAGVEPGYTLGVLPLDADRDGILDLYVACDSSPNRLLVNETRARGEPRFVERAFEASLALGADGTTEAGMGLAAGDVDQDGLLDLAVTNFSGEPTNLLLARPSAARATGFEHATFQSGLAKLTRPLLSWGAHLVDLDCDGRLELFSANGHVYPQADEPGTGTSYRQADAVLSFLPDEAGALRARPWRARDPRSLLAPAVGSRGSALGDLDGDGLPDLVLARIDAPAALGINRSAEDRRALELRLAGPLERDARSSGRATPRDATGAFVELEAKGTRFVAQLVRAQGYQSSSSPWIHLGLGASERFESLRVRWPSGRVEELGGGASDRRLWIREGEGLVREEALRRPP